VPAAAAGIVGKFATASVEVSRLAGATEVSAPTADTYKKCFFFQRRDFLISFVLKFLQLSFGSGHDSSWYNL
jgi:hypothetical protein